MVFLLRKLIKYAWLLMTFRCMDTPPFTIFTSGGWGGGGGGGTFTDYLYASLENETFLHARQF